MRTVLFSALLGLSLVPSMATAQLKESVNMRGQTSKNISGRLKGKEYVDYLVDVGAGQSVSVNLTGDVYFNFNPPKSDVSMYNGSVGGGKMEPRVVPSDGQYIIRVYQMGAAASENQSRSYSMLIRVKGTALKPVPRSNDAKVRGTPFHAQGQVEATVGGKTTNKCNASVIRRGRSGEGSATVELRFGGVTRRVLFVKGKPMASDSAESFSFRRSGDDNIIRFGDDSSEEYIIPDALVFGG